ncbi:phage tail protein I [Vibrio parahaemolyticus]
MSNSLLPPNASGLERDIEQVIVQSTDLPIRIKDLWDPYSCHLSLLPWLAWALSVDEWDDRWPEHIKRQVVQDSFDVHRFKGTPYAVQKALDSLNIKTHLREWWEPDGSQEPGTMTVVALINENLTDDDNGLITEAMLEQVTRVIHTAKRGVIHFDVELGISLEETLGLSGAIGPSIAEIDFSSDFLPIVPEKGSADMAFSAALYGIGSADFLADISGVVPDESSSHVFVCGGLAGISASWLEFEGDL